MLVIKDIASNARCLVTSSKENVAVIFGCVFIQGVAISNSHLRATIVFIELEVHHAGDRIRAVRGRSAIFQNLDALNSWNGNGGQIGEGESRVGGPWKRSNTAAIEQNQRSAGVKTTQRDRSRSRRACLAGSVVLHRHTARTHYRLSLEKLFRGGALTGLVNQVAVEIEHRVRTHLFCGGNIRTGHDHSLNLRSRSGRSGTRRRWWWRRACSKCIRCYNEWKSDARHKGDTRESELI